MIGREARKIRRYLRIAYFIQTVLRTGVEACFLYYFYKNFPRTVEPLFRCRAFPCPNTVDCFISRPKEKEFVTNFLFYASIISLVIAMLDIYWILVHYIRKKLKRKLFKTRLVNIKDIKEYK